jgi:hypothetical protein
MRCNNEIASLNLQHLPDQNPTLWMNPNENEIVFSLGPCLSNFFLRPQQLASVFSTQAQRLASRHAACVNSCMLVLRH